MPAAGIGPGQRPADAADFEHRRGSLVLPIEVQRDAQQPVVALERHPKIGRVNAAPGGIVDQLNGAPRPDDVDRRLPAGHVAEQRRAHLAKRIVLDELGAPARPAALASGQCAVERPEDDGQLVVAGEIDGNGVGQEHVVRGQDRRAVQPDLGDGREAEEAQGAAAAAGKAGAIPDVLIVQAGGVLDGPAPGGTQPLRGRAWCLGGDPVECRRQGRGLVRGIGRGQRHLPALAQADCVPAGDGDHGRHQANRATSVPITRS